MRKHFVEYLYPGTFLSESHVEPILAWDVGIATLRSKDGNTKPYGFRFLTRARTEDELDSKVVDTSGIYYLGGTVRTYDEVVADNLPADETLRWNMKANHFARVITTAGRTFPFTDKDQVIE